MDYIEHTLMLSSGYGRNVPPGIAAGVLDSIGPMVRSSILMAFEGRGSARRRPPKWLKHASDVRFLGAEGHQGMVFRFSAPKLGTAAEDIYRQRELWPTKPAPEDTGFDLLCRVLQDVGAEKGDSDLFDDKVLDKVLTLRPIFRLGAQQLELSGHRIPAKKPIKVTNETLVSAQRLTHSTPPPQAVRFSGMLDMIRVSTQRFAVKLESGEELGGVFLGGDIKELGSLLDKRVVVAGQVIYRPSGRMLRVDADRVVSGEGEAAIWSQIPSSVERPLPTQKLHKRQGPKSGVATIIGRWPGDETDEQVDEALAEMS